MKKLLLIISLLFVLLFSKVHADTISINPWETRTISFSQELESISFSKDTDFFIKTMTGGVWSDVWNNVSEYSPLNWYIVSNSTGEILNINYINKSDIGVGDTLLQTTLFAWWNLIWIASDNIKETIVNWLGNWFNYSRIVDFSDTNFNSNNAWTLLWSSFNVSNYWESWYMHEWTAYAIFISNEQILSWVQSITNWSWTISTETIEVEIRDEWVNTSVKIWAIQADLGEFKITNNWSNDNPNPVDLNISSITLKEIWTIDEIHSLENITLTVSGSVISTVASMSNNYITFNINDYIIPEGDSRIFTVKADIIWWAAGSDVEFSLENNSDIVSSSNLNITWTYQHSVVDIDTWEITLSIINAINDEIRQSKTNIVLWQLEIINAGYTNLELQNFGIDITTTNSWVLQILENVEFELIWTSYDLFATWTLLDTSLIFTWSNLGITLPQWTTTLTIRADTLGNIINGTLVTLSLDTSNNFKIIENAGGIIVTDITPSSLLWDSIEVVVPSATISNVPLADIEVVKGATDLVALQFEIGAGKVSDITNDRMSISLNEDNISGTGLTNSTISEISLYRNSVSESNLLDKIAGSKLSNGVATFDWYDYGIQANSTWSFIVTVSTVDTAEAIGKIIVVSVNTDNIDLEDDENDIVSLASEILYDKIITLIDYWKLIITADTNNTDNEKSKSILAWEEHFIYSLDAIAINEEVNVETVVFTLDANLKTVIDSAKLYLDDTIVATASNYDILDSSNSTITFDNISNLDFHTTSSELRLAIITETIWFWNVWEAIVDVSVINVSISDAEGVDSGEMVTVTDLSTAGSNTFDVVPATIVASINDEYWNSDDTAKILFSIDTWDNTDSVGNNIDVIFERLYLEVTWWETTGTLNVSNSNSEIIATSHTVGSNNIFLLGSDVSNEIITDWEIYTLVTDIEGAYKLINEGLVYSVDWKEFKMKLDLNQDMWIYVNN